MVYALVVPLVAATAAQAPRTPPAETAVVYRVDAMDRVEVRDAVPFATADGRTLHLDVYAPPDAVARERPVVVLLSGGEEVRAWEWYRSLGRLVAAHGLVAIVPEKRYRRGFEGVRDGYADTETALAYLQEHGPELGVDADRICLWAFSAGGRLSAVGLRAGARGIQCLAIYYGVMDVSGEIPGGVTAAERDRLLRRYSPLHALEAVGSQAPSLFVARAGRDAESLNAGIDRFAATALRVNAAITVVNYAEGDHGFDGWNDTEQSRAILRATLTFLRDALR